MPLLKYLALPREITPFEQRYLTRMNKIALIFFYLHIPAFMGVAWVAGTQPLQALLLTLFVLAGPTLAYRSFRNPRLVSVVYGITAMLMGGLLVHFGQGPVQIEMHFYFFALLAMLCMFANPMVNLAAALTVALHHLIVWLLVPASVFNYEAQWWVVLVHAAFVILETIAACYISREFFDNVIGLEKIVQARTATIHEKQHEMRLILDHVETGLVTIDIEGRMASEMSLVLSQWFGSPAEGARLSDWLAARDASFAEWLELGLESVADGMLPPDVALAQLPRLIKDGTRTYSVHYQLIKPPAELGQAEDKLLVIVSDISERLRHEASGRYQAELLQLFQQIMRDKNGFIEFLAEADEMMQTLAQGRYESLEHLKRLIHTLKGNTALFSMRRVPELCHELESLIAEENIAPSPEALAGLVEAWQQVRRDLAQLLGEQYQHGLVIGDADYEAMLRAVSEGVEPEVLRQMLVSWRLEPARLRLVRIEEQLLRLAERQGKPNLRVELAPGDLRYDAARFAPFWTAFVHLLRNTVDHGLEAPEQRQAQGKPADVTVRLATRIEANTFVISLSDDGPGIDWDTLAARARALGHEPLPSREELPWLSGVSSLAGISETSGRGVGMAAVRTACEQLGGHCDLVSQPGAGTTFNFRFPANQGVYAGHAALLQPASHPKI